MKVCKFSNLFCSFFLYEVTVKVFVYHFLVVDVCSLFIC